MNQIKTYPEMNAEPYLNNQKPETAKDGFDTEDIRVQCPDENYHPTELNTFEEANFPPQFYQIFNQLNFVKPTPIQKFAIPVAMDCKDLIGIAKTGSGKTLAFMLPALQAVIDEKNYYYEQNKFYDNKMTPMGLVLAPTRELANQIYEASYEFGKACNVQMRVVYGGQDIFTQKKKLREGVDILIGTPGRIIDLIERNALNLSRVFYWVLDEADRMLDMGFLPQVKNIISVLPAERQTLMWSATWPKEVQSLANEVCLYAPVTIHVGEENLTINSKIEQIILCMNEGKKFDELCRITNEIQKNSSKAKILIFARTKRGCDKLCESLENIGFRAYSIHGDKSQVKRDTIIAQYKKNYKNILVATDVASRGLDIKDIGHVVNFDFPMTIEDYIHRIGRTGRAGASGVSYTFFTSNDICFSTILTTVLKKSGQKVPQLLIDWTNEFRNKRGGKSKPYTFSRYNQNFYSNNDRPFKFNGYNQNNNYNGGGGGGFDNRGGNFNSRGGGYNNNASNNNGFSNDFGLQRGSLYKVQGNMMQNNVPQNNNNFNYQGTHFSQQGNGESAKNVQTKNPGLFAAPANANPQQNMVQYNNATNYNANYNQQNYDETSNNNNDFNNYSNAYQDFNTQNYYDQKDYNNNGYDYNQSQGFAQQENRSNNNNTRQNYNANANYGNTNEAGYNNEHQQDYKQQDKRYNNNENSQKVGNKFDAAQPRKFTNTKGQIKNSGLFAGDEGDQQLNQIGKNNIVNPNLYADN